MKQIISIIIFVGIINSQIFSQQIKLEGHLQKSTYLLGEPIDFILSIINATDEKITKKFDGLEIGLRNEDNDFLLHGVRSGGFPQILSVNLEPKDTTYWTADLINVYGQSYKSNWLYLFLPVGKYSLEITFAPTNMKSQKQTLEFQIQNPEGDEAVVYNSFMEVGSRKHTIAEEVNTIESLFKKYPNSVYMPFLLMDLESCYEIGFKNHQKALEIRGKIIENYPLSTIAISPIDSILKEISTSSKRIEFLNGLKQKSKGSLIEKIYEQKIKEIEKN